MFDGVEKLERHGEELELKQLEQRLAAKKTKRLREKYDKLVNNRNALRKKLQILQSTSMSDAIKQRTSLNEFSDHDDKNPSVDNVLLAMKKQHLENILKELKHTGITGNRVSDNCILITFHTWHHDTPVESYYMELRQMPQLQIGQHTLPVFIPVKDLEEKYINTDLTHMLSIIHERLSAYVMRREEFKHVQERYTDLLDEKIEVTFPATFAKIAFRPGIPQSSILKLMINLQYSDPCSVRPDRVSITVKQEEESSPITERTVEAWRKLLKSLALPAAVSKILTPD